MQFLSQLDQLMTFRDFESLKSCVKYYTYKYLRKDEAMRSHAFYQIFIGAWSIQKY